MGSPSPRQTLTAAAEHLSTLGHPHAAAAVDAYRDLLHPAPPVKHRWNWIQSIPLIKRCVKCGLSEEWRPLIEGGPIVSLWVHRDGTIEQLSKVPLPKCVGAES